MLAPINNSTSSNKIISFKSRWLDDVYYDDEQEKIAKDIAKIRLKDWPDGLDDNNRWRFGIDDGLSLAEKPKNDYDYHELLLKQKVKLPPKPPEYYRNYDKWFNTKKYRAWLTWPDYIAKTKLFNKLKKLINYLYLENLALEKLKKEEEAKKTLQSAFIKSQLIKEFLSFFNSEEKAKAASIPNAIMIEGKDTKESKENIKWLVSRANANYLKINRQIGMSDEDYLATIDSVLDECRENYEKSKKRSLLYIEDFDSLIQKGNAVGDIKDLLPTLNSEYKTTLVFSTTDSKKLDPITLQDHRVNLKIKIKDKISADDFVKLQLDFLRANITKIGKTDGYKFNYIPGTNKNVDLYLGCFGCNDKILWLEHKSVEDIEYAVKFIDAIKRIKCFKNIEKIQCSMPTDMSKARELGFYIISALTKDMKAIIEKRI